MTSVETGCQVAASETDFDDTQDVNGWFYGFWLAQDDPTYEPDTDFELGVFDGTSGGRSGFFGAAVDGLTRTGGEQHRNE